MLRFFICSIFLIISSVVHADIMQKLSCREKNISPEVNVKAIQASKKLENWLNEQGAEAIAIGRRGQNLSQHEIEFSHVAYGVRESNQSWSVWHLLNECPTHQSGVYKESMKEFLIVAPDQYEVAIVLFPKKIETTLRDYLNNAEIREALYEPFYSSVAHPYQLSNQNSNGWIIEFFASVLEQKPLTRKKAQRRLKAYNYRPDLVSLNMKQTILSQLFVGNATLSGHRIDDIKDNRIYLHSGDSILNFMAKFGRDVIDCSNDLYLMEDSICVFSVGEK